VEKGLTKKRLDELKSDIKNVEDDLIKQEEQIEGLNEELEIKKIPGPNGKNTEIEIKNELSSLVEKYGIGNLSNVLKGVKSSKNLAS
jgi:predicted  nucleic acid-binding Zn-ribbon protein